MVDFLIRIIGWLCWPLMFLGLFGLFLIMVEIVIAPFHKHKDPFEDLPWWVFWHPWR